MQIHIFNPVGFFQYKMSLVTKQTLFLSTLNVSRLSNFEFNISKPFTFLIKISKGLGKVYKEVEIALTLLTLGF